MKRGAASIRHVLQICPVELPEQDHETGRTSVAIRLGTVNETGTTTTDADDWLEYGAAELQTRNTRRRLEARYNVQAEFLQPAGWISRTPEGKFVVADEGARQIHPTYGYYSPARSPIVESGVYRIGGDRLIWPRPKPILRRELSPVPPISGILPTMISQPTDYPVAMPSHSTVTSPQFGRRRISTQPSSPHLVPGSPQEAIRSSSPGPGFLLSPSLANFSDMSSVRHPSSAERSLHTTFSSRLSSFQKQQTPDLPPRQNRLNRFFPTTVALSSSVSPNKYIQNFLPSYLSTSS